MNNILPFSGFLFFLLSLSTIALLHIFKPILRSIVSYKYLIFFVVVEYIVLFLPTHVSFSLLQILIYTYLAYFFFAKRDIGILVPALVVAIPMVLFKLDVHPVFRILGISYITFRTIQAIVDAKNFGELDVVEFTCFLLFPTTLLAGPIDRSYRFVDDLKNGYDNLTYQNFFKGWELLILGLLFKFVCGELVFLYWLSDIDESSTEFATMANSAYAYTTYLFFDFAGYSSMAVGLATMIGINTPINFNHPYLATSPQDFWRRFHITLGSWLTDYFFKPIYKYLHGIKLLKGRRLLIQNMSITATFLLMGAWNGFTWYYVFSGLLFGIYSSVHNSYVLYVRKGGFDVFSIFPEIVSVNLKRILMVNAAVFSLYFFSGRVPYVF